MERGILTNLTTQDMRNIEGGMQPYTCALLGGFTAAAFLTGNWWAVGGGLIAAYNGGCFEM